MPIVPILYSPVQSSPVHAAERSERVILRRYFNRKELVQDRNLLHDVVAHLGDFGEEEEGEESGYTAEAGGEATVFRGLLKGEAVVVLGDGVLRTKRTPVSLVRAAHADSSGRLAVVAEG